MSWTLRAYSVILLAYTGWRTYDFISGNLPKNDLTFWLSIAFLFATEAGLALWHEFHLHKVTTDTQDKITLAMTWLDFIGSLAAGTADMILRQTFIDGYQIPPALAQLLIYGLPAIVAANVAAVILFEEHDAETQENKAELAAKFEIHRQAMQQLKANRRSIGVEKSGLIYDQIRGRVTSSVDNVYGQVPALPADEPEHDEEQLLARLNSFTTTTGEVTHPNGSSRNGRAH